MRSSQLIGLSCFALTFLFTDVPVEAASPAEEVVAPLGFAIGKVTRKEVENGLRGKTSIKNLGINRYSGGTMLTAPGKGLGVEGLRDALFLFNEKDTLTGVILELDKGGFNSQFDRIYEYLASKYPLVEKRLPSVGNRYARFRKGSVVIELEVRHMSFTMDLTYLTEDLERRYRSMKSRESEQKQTRERGQF